MNDSLSARTTQWLRQLPSVDQLLGHEIWSQAASIPLAIRTLACRLSIAEYRASILAADPPDNAADPPDDAVPLLAKLATSVLAKAHELMQPQLRPVVNATGVVLHTNLGRAPLGAAAIEALARSAGCYLNLEMDLMSGQRDSRHDRLGEVFARVLGCEDVAIVTNNAAAVFLALQTVVEGQNNKQVVVSRGELVEIGGSFRMPDIMTSSGAQMMEVGTTNRCHVADYERALQAGAQVVIKVHRSNFELVGFVSEVDIAELAPLCRRHAALLLYDLGSGLLQADPALGQQCVRRALDAGADLVLFSGDKLLGGPQAGIVAGHRELIERLRRQPMMRLMRPGKLTLLALEQTLLAWEREPQGGEIPVAAMIQRAVSELEQQGIALARQLDALQIAAKTATRRVQIEVISTQSTTGGGSAAWISLPSYAVALTPVALATESEASLARALRQGEPAVVSRIERGRVLLDMRTLLDGDEERIVQAFGRWLDGG